MLRDCCLTVAEFFCAVMRARNFMRGEWKSTVFALKV